MPSVRSAKIGVVLSRRETWCCAHQSCARCTENCFAVGECSACRFFGRERWALQPAVESLAVAARGVVLAVLLGGWGAVIAQERCVAVGAVGREGRLGVVSAGDSVRMLRLGDDGSLAEETSATLPTLPEYEYWGMGIGDFDGDGHDDIALATRLGFKDPHVVLWNDGAGAFNRTTPTRLPGVGLNHVIVAVADLNGDGIADLYIAQGGDRLYRGSKNRELDLVYDEGELAHGTKDVAVCDMDRDGRAEVLVIKVGIGLVKRWENGDGEIREERIEVEGADDLDAVAVMDVMGTDAPEIVMTTRMGVRKGGLLVGRLSKRRVEILTRCDLHDYEKNRPAGIAILRREQSDCLLVAGGYIIKIFEEAAQVVEDVYCENDMDSATIDLDGDGIRELLVANSLCSRVHFVVPGKGWLARLGLR